MQLCPYSLIWIEFRFAESEIGVQIPVRAFLNAKFIKTCLLINSMNPLKQLKIIEKQSGNLVLAADWKKPWNVLISTMLSAQTKDETTIKISKKLYKKFNSLEKLANAGLKDIRSIIRPVNYYKTKAKNIKKTAQIIIKKFKGKIPHKIENLLELPGVGRKTAEVPRISVKTFD